MAGYNRDIVATRKLNKKNKARLEATGDTEYGIINGVLSHISKDEKTKLDNADQLTAAGAYEISLREKVEDEIASKGAGTINPFDGMPEYHEFMEGHFHEDAANPNSNFKPHSAGALPTYFMNVAEHSEGLGNLSYEEYEDLDPTMKESWLGSMDITEDKLKYISEFEQKPFEFLEKEKGLTEEFALGQKGLSEKGLLATKEASAREADIAGRGIGETYRGARESLGTQLTTGSRAIGRSMAQARTGAESAMARSGLATSGTISGAMGQQMKALTQDYGQLTKGYTQGIAAAGRQADIGRAGIAAGEETAAAQYDLGMEQTAFDYDRATKTAEFDYGRNLYDEQRRQMEKLYGEITTVGGM